MRHPLAILAVGGLLAALSSASGAPKSTIQGKVLAKESVDPLAIPTFAPIPNEFVFAGTRQDVNKPLARYTGGVSLDKLPEPTPQQLAASKDKDTLEGLLEVKRILAPIHVVRVRSISYFALDEAAQKEAFKKLATQTKQEAETKSVGEIELQNRGYDRSLELLRSAETFYKDLLAKQGGQIQMQLRGETSITVYAFAQPRTFAVVTRGPSRVIVARADGKPDVGAIASIFQRVVAGG